MRDPPATYPPSQKCSSRPRQPAQGSRPPTQPQEEPSRTGRHDEPTTSLAQLALSFSRTPHVPLPQDPSAYSSAIWTETRSQSSSMPQREHPRELNRSEIPIIVRRSFANGARDVA